jgi:hypothetical protein
MAWASSGGDFASSPGISAFRGAVNPFGRGAPFTASKPPRTAPARPLEETTMFRATNAARTAAPRPFGRTALAAALALTLGAAAGSTAACATVGTLDVVTRDNGQALPVYPKDGRRWVVGTPGREYSVRVCNRTNARVLAVMSVDGVNIVTGATAAPLQSGYVLSAWECADISGWRKSMERTAAFYFTELPDAYATRTGRPENVGVIGVAFFREKAPPVVSWKDKVSRLEATEDAASGGRYDSKKEIAQGAARNEAQSAERSRADAASPAPPAAAPLAKLGTGHGRSEESPTQMVAFERESDAPNETIAIHYDRRENLVAMGVLPRPYVARSPNPFPAWPHFVPDPR